MRLAATPQGALAERTSTVGRSVYTCRSRACFDRAAERRAFARVLRRPVTVDASLASHLYTEA